MHLTTCPIAIHILPSKRLRRGKFYLLFFQEEGEVGDFIKIVNEWERVSKESAEANMDGDKVVSCWNMTYLLDTKEQKHGDQGTYHS